MINFKLIVVFTIGFNFCLAQDILQIYFTRLGSFKKYEILTGETLEYKLRGERKFRTDKIWALQDSNIVFESGEEIKLAQLKRIRFYKNNILIRPFVTTFKRAGFMFIILNTLNNVILKKPEIITPKAVLISASLFAVYFFLKRINYKNLRITRRKTLKIVHLDFENLNKKEH